MINYNLNYDKNKTVRNKLMRRFSCFDGVGVDLRGTTDFNVALEKSGLNYEVEKVPMFLNNGTLVKNHFCTIKTDDNSQTGVVGNDYCIVNNQEAFSVAKIIADEGNGTYETGGASLRKRNVEDYSKTFMVLRHEDIEILGDSYNSFSVFRNSFDGSSGVQMMFINLRLICLNGMTRQMPGQKQISRINIQHSRSAEQKIEIAHETMRQQREYVKQLQIEAEALANTPFSKKEFEKEIIPMVLREMKLDKDDRKRGSENLDNTIAQIVAAYDADDTQNFNNTAYKVMLTLSDFESHVNPLRNTDNPHLYFNRVLSGMMLTNVVVNHIIKSRNIAVNYKK